MTIFPRVYLISIFFGDFTVGSFFSVGYHQVIFTLQAIARNNGNNFNCTSTNLPCIEVMGYIIISWRTSWHDQNIEVFLFSYQENFNIWW